MSWDYNVRNWQFPSFYQLSCNTRDPLKRHYNFVGIREKNKKKLSARQTPLSLSFLILKCRASSLNHITIHWLSYLSSCIFALSVRTVFFTMAWWWGFSWEEGDGYDPAYVWNGPAHVSQVQSTWESLSSRVRGPTHVYSNQAHMWEASACAWRSLVQV